MSFIVPVLAARRKRLMSEFEKNGAIGKEQAVSIQEMYDNWQIRVFKPLRMRALTMDIRFLCRRGRLVKTDNEKYFLTSSK